MVEDNNQNRGFSSMDNEKQKDISKKGSENVKPDDRGFKKDPGAGSEAGRKTSESSHDDKHQQ